jgi:hypothetical protein
MRRTPEKTMNAVIGNHRGNGYCRIGRSQDRESSGVVGQMAAPAGAGQAAGVFTHDRVRFAEK